MIELWRRNSEVEQDAVDLSDLQVSQDGWNVCVFSVNQLGAFAERSQPLPRGIERGWIAVDPDQCSGRKALQKGRGVPGATQRSIDINPVIPVT